MQARFSQERKLIRHRSLTNEQKLDVEAGSRHCLIALSADLQPFSSMARLARQATRELAFSPSISRVSLNWSIPVDAVIDPELLRRRTGREDAAVLVRSVDPSVPRA